jgi:magnesium transporter
VIVDCAVYDNGRRRAEELALEDACQAASEPGKFVWIGLFEPTVEEFESISREFSLHPLAVEDALSAHERPKLEEYGDMRFLVLKTARYDDAAETVHIGEIMCFVATDFLITVRHGEAPDLTDVRSRMEDEEDRLKYGTMAALHAILDKVVDDYEPVVLGLQTDVDEVEGNVFGQGREATSRIYRLGREVLLFSRAVQPLLQPVAELTEGRAGRMESALQDYFRDVNDHLLRVNQQVDAYHELLGNLLQANLTLVSVQQNNDMRKISAWVAIVAVPTLFAGIYGMNFEHMPELEWRLGYPAVLLVMLTVCGSLYVRFKKAGWL